MTVLHIIDNVQIIYSYKVGVINTSFTVINVSSKSRSTSTTTISRSRSLTTIRVV